MGCAGTREDRGSYLDYIRVDERPPLVGSGPAADSLLGPPHESDLGDGIAESHRAKLQELVERFAPTLVLPKNDQVEEGGERFRLLPTNVHLFADTLRLDIFRMAPYQMHASEDIAIQSIDEDSLLGLVRSSLLDATAPDLVAAWYFDFPGTRPRDWWNAYARLRTGPDSTLWATPTTYAHPFQDPLGRTIIQYWYFYPFNGDPGRDGQSHQGMPSWFNTRHIGSLQ
jgi:hypothetical protein